MIIGIIQRQHKQFLIDIIHAAKVKLSIRIFLAKSHLNSSM